MAMSGLGGVIAVISLDISPLESAAAKASSILQNLGNVKSNGLDSVSKDLDGVAKSVDGLGRVKIDIDASGATSEAKGVADAVEKVGTAVKETSNTKLKIDAGSAKSDLKETEAAAKSLGDQVEKLEGSFSKVGGTLSVLGGGVTAAFGLAANKSNNFEQAMQNVQSIAKVSKSDLDGMSKSIMEISKTTGKGPQDLAEALYDVASSGFEGADGLEVLEKSAIAARAGMTDTGVAVKGVTAVLNAYKMDASEAGNVTDVLFKTVDSGVITFEQLAQNMGQVLPLAANLKVSIQELGAAYATLTLSGISPAESETAIAAVMRSAINPTQELTAAVKEYGYASAEALIQAEGFSGYLAVLDQASGGSSEALTNLLGTADATTAVLALLANNGQDYTNMLNEMTAATQNGATTQGVLAVQMDSTQASLQNAGAAFDRFQIAVGQALGPAIRVGADALTALLNGFSELPGPIQSAVAIIGAFGGVMTLMAGAFLLAVPKVVEFISAIQKLREMATVAAATSKLQGALSALSFVVSPLGIALTAVVAVGALVAKSWYDQKKASDEYNGSLKNLSTTIEQIRRQGDDTLADLAQGSVDLFQDLEKYNVDMGEWTKKRSKELMDQGLPNMVAGKQAGEEWAKLAGDIDISQEKITTANNLLTEALTDTTINPTKYINWRNELINTALAIEDPIERAKALDAALDEINSTPLSKFRDDAEDAAAGADELTTATEKLNAELKRQQEYALASADAIAEMYRASNGKYPDNNDERELADALARRDLLHKELLALTAAGGDPEAIEAMTGELAAANDEAEELLEKTFRLMTLLAIQGDKDSIGVQGALDAGFNHTNERAENRKRQQDFLSEITVGPAGKQTASWMESVATSAAQATIAVQAGAAATNAWANAAEKTAAATEKIMAAEKDTISSYLQATGNDNFTSQLNLAGMGTSYSNLAEHVNDANTAMSDGFRIVVGNTTAIAQNAQQVTDWATDLINVEGTYGKIDDLLANNTISQDEYTAAQRAYNDIAADNASIQEDILTIQAKQAPVMAQLMAGTQDYVETLSTLPPMQQAVALGWMDANESAKANQMLTMAAAAANGELGAKGKQATTAMIQGAVAADPYLKAMLLDMGLISEGADGTITVNFEGAQGVKATLDDLNASLIVIADILDDGEINGSIDIKIKGRKELEETKAMLEGMGGKTYSVTVNAGGAAKKNLIDNYGDGTIIHMDSIIDPPPPAEVPEQPTVHIKAVIDVGSAAVGSAQNAAGKAASAMGEMNIETKEIAVNVTVSGAELIGALKLDLQNLSNRTVNVMVAVNGAELVGALKLDVQNLNNKTVTVTAVVSGAELIGALKLDIQNLSDKTVTITTTYAQSNAEAMISIAGAVNQAISAVPSAWMTAYTQTGAEDVISIAGAVNQAISAVPSTWNTAFSSSGADDVIGAANSVASAVNAVPSTKTVTISVATAGAVPAFAAGGRVGGGGNKFTLSQLAERGPELFRTPRGQWGLARTNGIYPMVPGTYVYTAGRTKNMLRNWEGPSFASGGRVPAPTASAQRGTSSVVSNTYRVEPNITINPQSTLTDRELEHVMDQVGDAVATAVQNKRTAKGGE